MQSGSPCEEDPALPVLFALIRPLKKVACDFFSEGHTFHFSMGFSGRMVSYVSNGWWIQGLVGRYSTE